METPKLKIHNPNRIKKKYPLKVCEEKVTWGGIQRCLNGEGPERRWFSEERGNGCSCKVVGNLRRAEAREHSHGE